jgi:hypothetical protein
MNKIIPTKLKRNESDHCFLPAPLSGDTAQFTKVASQTQMFLPSLQFHRKSPNFLPVPSVTILINHVRLRFSRLLTMTGKFGTWHSVLWYKFTYVSEELTTSFFRV